MATKKQKEKKKKDRERLAHARVVQRRDVLRAQRKLSEEEERKRQEIEYMTHGKPQPIIVDEEKAAEREAAKARAVTDQLKKNLEILEALEQEYEQEQQVRVEVNEKLESEGYMSIKQKMDALHQKALEMTGKAELLAEAQEEYVAQQKEEEIEVVQDELDPKTFKTEITKEFLEND